MNNKATYDQVALLRLKAHSPAFKSRGVWHDRVWDRMRISVNEYSAICSNLRLFLTFYSIFGGYAVVCSEVGRNLYPYTRFVPQRTNSITAISCK